MMGKCDAVFMTRFNYCAETCGRAPCEECDDKAPGECRTVVVLQCCRALWRARNYRRACSCQYCFNSAPAVVKTPPAAPTHCNERASNGCSRADKPFMNRMRAPGMYHVRHRLLPESNVSMMRLTAETYKQNATCTHDLWSDCCQQRAATRASSTSRGGSATSTG